MPKLIPFGEHEMTVVNHGVFQPEGKSAYVKVTFVHDGDAYCDARVYISDDAAGMAHVALKKIGFDTHKQNVFTLQDNPNLLRGKKAMVKVFEDDYGGKVRTKYEILMSDPAITKQGAEKLDGYFKKLKPSAGSDEEMF